LKANFDDVTVGEDKVMAITMTQDSENFESKCKVSCASSSGSDMSASCSRCAVTNGGHAAFNGFILFQYATTTATTATSTTATETTHTQFQVLSDGLSKIEEKLEAQIATVVKVIDVQVRGHQSSADDVDTILSIHPQMMHLAMFMKWSVARARWRLDAHVARGGAALSGHASSEENPVAMRVQWDASSEAKPVVMR
jgi:hypothetical protein